MPVYALQKALDHLPVAFNDAMLLNTAVVEQLARLREQRRASEGKGGGRPSAPHRALNRAVVVAAVGGIEAFFEQLATEAKQLIQAPRGSGNWYPITGRAGALQTPSPENIRRLYWGLFRVDLEPHWSLSIGTSDQDRGMSGTWRRQHNHVHSGEDATDFLNAMLQVRHSFAHMEPKNGRAVGMARSRQNGEVSVQSHHAFNAVSSAIQVAIQSTIALGDSLQAVGTPRWRTSWERAQLPMSTWLVGSPLWEQITKGWMGKFVEQDGRVDAAVAAVEGQESAPTLELP